MCNGVGTSSEEGVGLCFAICEHLLQKKACLCVCMCVCLCVDISVLI